MFTWICPQCGREVPPSFDACPDCAKKAAGAAAVLPPPPPGTSPQDLSAAQAPPPPPPPVYQAPPSHSGLPTWLLTILFAFAFLGIGAGIYWTVGYLKNSSNKPTATVESPAAKPGTSASPYQKYIEVSGVRFTQDEKKKLVVRYVITNHSGADLAALAGNVTIWGRTQKSEEDAAGTFTFSTNLRPFESKDLVAALNTKLSAIELPDWQNISTDIQITGPK